MVETATPACWPRPAAQSPDYFFPSRLHEQIVLEWALQQPGQDPVAAYGLGNYFYDLKRHEDAITVWERAVADGASFATVFRNLGIAHLECRAATATPRANFYLRALELGCRAIRGWFPNTTNSRETE